METADSFIFVFRGSQNQEDFITDLESQVELIADTGVTKEVFGGDSKTKKDGPNVPKGFFDPFKQ